MDNSTALDLSELLRKRWNIALSHLPEISKSCSIAQAYDVSLWGNPAEWSEIAPQQHSLANLLFPIGCVETPAFPECTEEGKVYLYADMVDGYFSIHRHQGVPGAEWEEKQFSFEKFCKEEFVRKISKYENHADKVYWGVAGMDDEAEFGDLSSVLRKRGITRKRFPDMDGVSLHVDLSLSCLRIAYDEKGGTHPKILVLPAWGLLSWLKGLARPVFAEKVDTTLKMLVDNKSTAFAQGEQLERALPADIECKRYLHLLFNLLPFRQNVAVRVSGWLSSKSFQMVAEPLFNQRFGEVTFTASYKTFTYEQ